VVPFIGCFIVQVRGTKDVTRTLQRWEIQGKLMFLHRESAWLVFAFSIAILSLHARVAGGSFVTFESGQVRPLAMSPDGTRLYAVNTPDNRLEIFDVSAGTLTHTGRSRSASNRLPSRLGRTDLRCGSSTFCPTASASSM
jgi:hypothetical protein